MSDVSCVSLKRWSRRGSKILRYIRCFGVISEVYCVSLRRKRMFENILLYLIFFSVLCDYSLFCFHRSLFLTRSKASCEHRRLGFSALCDLSETFFVKVELSQFWNSSELSQTSLIGLLGFSVL